MSETNFRFYWTNRGLYWNRLSISETIRGNPVFITIHLLLYFSLQTALKKTESV